MSDQTPPQYPSYPTGGEQAPPGYGPPPPAYGNQPPAYGASQQGPAIPYASWGARLGAYLLDGLIVTAVAMVPIVIGAIIAFSGSEVDPVTDELTSVNSTGVTIMVFGYLVAFVFTVWNQVFRQGRTGQSLGKKIVSIQVVRADSGQFLGAGLAFLRAIMMALLGGICFINYLWPLWDEKKQAWHDKVVGSVVIRK